MKINFTQTSLLFLILIANCRTAILGPKITQLTNTPFEMAMSDDR